MSFTKYLKESVEEVPGYSITQDLLENAILSQYSIMERDVQKYSLPQSMRKLFDKVDNLSYTTLYSELADYVTEGKTLNQLRDMLVNKLIAEATIDSSFNAVQGAQVTDKTNMNLKNIKAKALAMQQKGAGLLMPTKTPGSSAQTDDQIISAADDGKGETALTIGKKGAPANTL